MFFLTDSEFIVSKKEYMNQVHDFLYIDHPSRRINSMTTWNSHERIKNYKQYRYFHNFLILLVASDRVQ